MRHRSQQPSFPMRLKKAVKVWGAPWFYVTPRSADVGAETLAPGWADGRVWWAGDGPSWSETGPGPRGPFLAQPEAGGLGPPGLEMALRPLQLAVRGAWDPGCPGCGDLRRADVAVRAGAAARAAPEIMTAEP